MAHALVMIGVCWGVVYGHWVYVHGMHDCFVQNSLGTVQCHVLPACLKDGIQNWVIQVHLKGGVQAWVVQVHLKGGVQAWVVQVHLKGGV